MENRSRYIENPYPDYQGGEPFSPEMLNMVENQMQNLLGVLENNYKPDDGFTVYTGTAGMALMYLQLYLKLDKDPQRKKYLVKAKNMIEISFQLKNMRGNDVTFLCGRSGPLSIAAVVYMYMGNKKLSEECVQNVRDLHKDVKGNKCLPDELLYGRVGYIYSLLFMDLQMQKSNNSDLIQQVCAEVLRRGEKLATMAFLGTPLMYEWYNTVYLGAAHGFMGILYILMSGLSGMDNNIETTLRQLLTLAFPSGNYPAAFGDKEDKLVHWCHGAPGWVFTLVKAMQYTEGAEMLEAALKCGEVVWKRGLLKKGYGICHGVSGNAYTFISLYKATQDPKHLHRAFKFVEFILDYGKHECRTPDTPFSLFEGMAGTVYFLADMLDYSNAKFPAYEI